MKTLPNLTELTSEETEGGREGERELMDYVKGVNIVSFTRNNAKQLNRTLPVQKL